MYKTAESFTLSESLGQTRASQCNWAAENKDGRLAEVAGCKIKFLPYLSREGEFTGHLLTKKRYLSLFYKNIFGLYDNLII